MVELCHLRIYTACPNLSLVYLPTVYPFKVLTPDEARQLRLAIDNIELLSNAARIGDNITVDVGRASQTVISQDRVYLSFDCSSLLLETIPVGEMPPPIMWARKIPSRT